MRKIFNKFLHYSRKEKYWISLFIIPKMIFPSLNYNRQIILYNWFSFFRKNHTQIKLYNFDSIISDWKQSSFWYKQLPVFFLDNPPQRNTDPICWGMTCTNLSSIRCPNFLADTYPIQIKVQMVACRNFCFFSCSLLNESLQAEW